MRGTGGRRFRIWGAWFRVYQEEAGVEEEEGERWKLIEGRGGGELGSSLGARLRVCASILYTIMHSRAYTYMYVSLAHLQATIEHVRI